MKIFRRLFLTLPLLLSAFLTTATSAYANVAMSLNPETATVPCPQIIETTIAIDATSNETDGARAVLTYDPKILQVTKIDAPTIAPFYPLLPVKDSTTTSGQITVVGLANETGPFPSGRGNLAMITFKTLAAGTSKVDFVKGTSSENNGSKVVSHSTNADILQETHSASYTVTGNCATPVPSVGAPTRLPEAGDDSFVFIVGLASLTLLVTGLVGYKLYK